MKHLLLTTALTALMVSHVQATEVLPQSSMAGSLSSQSSQNDYRQPGVQVIELPSMPGDTFHLDIASLDLQSDAAILSFRGQKIATLQVTRGCVIFENLTEQAFSVSGVPELDGLRVVSKAPVTFTSPVVCHGPALFDVQKTCSFEAGFCQDEKHSLHLQSGTFSFGGQSRLGSVFLSDTTTLSIKKEADVRVQGVYCGITEEGQLDFKKTATFRNAGHFHAEHFHGHFPKFLMSGASTTFLGECTLKTDRFNNTGLTTIGRGYLETEKVMNTKHLMGGNLDIVSFDTINKGHFSFKSLQQRQGNFHNTPSGTFEIAERFTGNFCSYHDDGTTRVKGLATIHAQEARVTNSLEATAFYLTASGYLSVPETAHFEVTHYLSLLSQADMDLEGSGWVHFNPESEKALGSLPEEIQRQIKTLGSGVSFSAQKDLRYQGVTRATGATLSFSAGETFSSPSSLMESGVFQDNSIKLSARHVEMMGQTRSHGSLHVTADSAVLQGNNRVDDAFVAQIKKTLLQKEADKTVAGLIFARSDIADLEGRFQSRKSTFVEAKTTLTTRGSSHFSGGATVLKSDVTTLGGHISDTTSLQAEGTTSLIHKDSAKSKVEGFVSLKGSNVSVGGHVDTKETLAIEGEDVTYEEDARVLSENAQTVGDRIVHKEGSRVRATKRNTEKARKSLTFEEGSRAEAETGIYDSGETLEIAGHLESSKYTITESRGATSITEKGSVKSGEMTRSKAGSFQNDGTMEAGSHSLESNSWFLNMGNIRSRNQFLIDTGFYFNLFGGSINAQTAIINADYAALSLFSNLGSRDLEINTLANLSAFSRLEGSRSMTVNAAFLNASFMTANQSMNYTSNSLVNFSELSLLTGLPISYALPSFDTKEWWDPKKSWYQQGITKWMARTGLVAASSYFGGMTGKAIQGLQTGLGVASLVSSGSDLYQDLMSYQDEEVPSEGRFRLHRFAKTFGKGLGLAMSAQRTWQSAQGVMQAPQPHKPVLLWDCTKNALKSTLGPSATINSVWNYEGALTGYNFNATGHVTRNTFFNQNFGTTMGLTNSTSVRSGTDLSTEYVLRSMTTTSGDYTFGGEKHVQDTFTAQIGGDLVLDESLQGQSGGDASFFVQGDLQAQKGSAFQSGENISVRVEGQGSSAGTFKGKEESSVIFKGNGTLLSGSSVESSEGQAIAVSTEGVLTTEAGSKVEGQEVFLQGKKGLIHGGQAVSHKADTIDVVSVSAGTDSMASSEGDLPVEGSMDVVPENLSEDKAKEQPVKPLIGTQLISDEGSVTLTGQSVTRATKGSVLVQAGESLETETGSTVEAAVMAQGRGQKDVSHGGSFSGDQGATLLAAEGDVLFFPGSLFTVSGASQASVMAPKGKITIENGARTFWRDQQDRQEVPVYFFKAHEIETDGRFLGVESLIYDAENKLTFGEHAHNVVKGTLSLKGSYLHYPHHIVSRGERLFLDAPNLVDIPALMTQSGRYSNFHFPGLVHVTVPTAVTFDRTQQAASQIFQLNASDITVDQNVCLRAPEQLILRAEKGDFTVSPGASVRSGIFTDIFANGNIVGGHQLDLGYWTSKHTQGHVQSATFLGASFEGGTGIEYFEKDPLTGENILRHLGLRVTSNGKVTGTGVTFSASGDVILDGQQGFENFGFSQGYLATYDKDKGHTRTKYQYGYDTFFFEGLERSTNGKVKIYSVKGGFHQEAGLISARDGIDILTRETISSGVLQGTKGKVTVRDYQGWLQKTCQQMGWGGKDSDHRRGIESTHHETTFQGPVRHLSAQGDIFMPGFVLEAPNSPYIFQGNLVTFERTSLSDRSRSQGWEWNFTAPSWDKEGKKGLKGFFKGVKNLLKNPGISHDYAIYKSGDIHEGAGHMVVGSLYDLGGADDNPGESLILGNGYDMTILGDMSLNRTHVIQEGARRSFYDRRFAFGRHCRLKNFRPQIGVHTDYRGSKGHSYKPSSILVGGDLGGNVGTWSQDAATVTAGTASIHVDKAVSRTRQDVVNTKLGGVDVSFDPLKALSGQVPVDVSIYGTPDRIRTRSTPDQRSGFFIGSALESFHVGHADLTGAKMHVGHYEDGAYLGPVSKHSLSREYDREGIIQGFGFSFDDVTKGFDLSSVSTNVTYQQGDHSYTVSAAISLSTDQKGNRQAHFTSLGLGYDDYTLSLNPEALFTEPQKIKMPDGSIMTTSRWDVFRTVSMGNLSLPLGPSAWRSTCDQFSRSTTKIFDLSRSLFGSSDQSQFPGMLPTPEVVESLDTLLAFDEESMSRLESSLASSLKDIPSSEVSLEIGGEGDDIDLIDASSLSVPKTRMAFTPSLSLDIGDESLEEGWCCLFDVTGKAGHVLGSLRESHFFQAGTFSSFSQEALRLPYEAGGTIGFQGPAGFIEGPSNFQYPIVVRSCFTPVTGAGQLETLYTPVTFTRGGNTYSFPYRVSGTNSYLQNPSDLSRALQARSVLSSSPSSYVQNGLRVWNDPNMATLYFSSETIPSGAIGEFGGSASLRQNWAHGPYGSQLLNGDYAAVAVYHKDPYFPFPEAHEIFGHGRDALNTGGYLNPCHVQGDTRATRQGAVDLLRSYAHDARQLGITTFREIPNHFIKSPYNIESQVMFNAPWQYFETTFKNNLLQEGIFMAPAQVNNILEAVEYDLIHGYSPSARYFSGRNVVTDGVGRSLIAAENGMVSEFRSFFTEADWKTPGIVQQLAPRTHAFLETLNQGPQFSSSSTRALSLYDAPAQSGIRWPVGGGSTTHLTLTQGNVFHQGSVLPALEVLPSNSLKGRVTLLHGGTTTIEVTPTLVSPWYQSTVAQDLKTIGLTALPVVCWGLDCFGEYARGYDFHDSIGRGTVRWGVNTGIYGGIYGGMGLMIGGPATIVLGGLSLGAEFLPTYTPFERDAALNNMLVSMRDDDPMSFFTALQQSRHMNFVAGTRQIFTLPRQAAEWTFDRLNETVPSFTQGLAKTSRYAGYKEMNEGNKELLRGYKTLNFIRGLFGADPYPVPQVAIETPAQIMAHVEGDQSIENMRHSIRKSKAEMMRLYEAWLLDLTRRTTPCATQAEIEMLDEIFSGDLW